MTETVDLVTRRNLVACDDNRGSQLTVFGKGSKTRSVLVPRSLFEELWALALLPSDAPRLPGRPSRFRFPQQLLSVQAPNFLVGPRVHASPASGCPVANRWEARNSRQMISSSASSLGP